MFFGHQGLEIGGGHVIWTALTLAPIHEEAVGDAPVQAQDQHALVALDAAAIIVVGNIQPLMEAAFDPPALAIEEQPLLSLEPLARGAGDQAHFFVIATLGLTQQAGGLGREGEADVLGGDGGGADDPILVTALVLLLGTGLGGRGVLRGENPLGERQPSFLRWPGGWAGCS